MTLHTLSQAVLVVIRSRSSKLGDTTEVGLGQLLQVLLSYSQLNLDAQLMKGISHIMPAVGLNTEIRTDIPMLLKVLTIGRNALDPYHQEELMDAINGQVRPYGDVAIIITETIDDRAPDLALSVYKGCILCICLLPSNRTTISTGVGASTVY